MEAIAQSARLSSKCAKSDVMFRNQTKDTANECNHLEGVHRVRDRPKRQEKRGPRR